MAKEFAPCLGIISLARDSKVDYIKPERIVRLFFPPPIYLAFISLLSPNVLQGSKLRPIQSQPIYLRLNFTYLRLEKQE